MAVTDPRAIKFVNEEIRPLAELARKFVAKVDNTETSWFAGISALIPNDAGEAIEDGREVEGVSRLTGADVNSLMSIIIAMRNAQNSDIIEKPTVRPIEIS